METQAENATYAIGELARRSGLPVKTIRYYSDIGVLPPTIRTASGYRRYTPADLIRLDLVRTLRELDLDLGTIRQVLDRQAKLADVLSLHAEALDAQVRALQVRRAVLRATVAAGASPAYLARAQQVTRLTATERTAVIHDFLDQVMADSPVHPAVAARFRRHGAPTLPDEPTAEQIDAWVELAELVTDDDYVSRLRAGVQWFWRAAGERYEEETYQAAIKAVMTAAGDAVRAGVPADAPTARPAIDDFARTQAKLLGRRDGQGFRRWLLDQYAAAYDPRTGRYWELVAVINGWPAGPSPVAAAWAWIMDGLRATATPPASGMAAAVRPG
jgi:DNA-binding transcriptional MerR regulator